MYAQCVLVSASTFNYIIRRSLIIRRVNSDHYPMSTPIRVPQCLQLEFLIVKCDYLLFDASFLLFFSIAYYQKVGFEVYSLKKVHRLFSHLFQYQHIWCVQQLFSISQVQKMIPIVFVLICEPWNIQVFKTQKRR